MKSVLTIAGSDSSGGAGIQADIKTIAAHHLFAQSAITALTAQNTTGVFGVHDVPPEFVAQQIDTVFDDIRPDAVKIGMVSSAEIVEAIADSLKRNGARNIVVDPVMVATSGSNLASDDAVIALRQQLMPLADVVTPNIPEAEVLTGFEIAKPEDQEKAACRIAESIGVATLVKGGHGMDDANDVLAIPKSDRSDSHETKDDSHGSATMKVIWFHANRIDNPNTHGTGCTLSSAIACGLAIGLPVDEAVRHAKRYLTSALEAHLDIGRGSGPLDHLWKLQQE